jgi:hypothetical protein
MSRQAPLGYWVLWTAGAISFLGDGITFGALPLLAASMTGCCSAWCRA